MCVLVQRSDITQKRVNLQLKRDVENKVGMAKREMDAFSFWLLTSAYASDYLYTNYKLKIDLLREN